jgi:S-(hydroxymethyl)glutathione dehydrogenase/alcohol dehydrogenase
MTRSISVFGLGYVGSVSAACFAKQGFPVVGVDLNQDRKKWGERFGMTHFVNPREAGNDLVKHLVDLTKGGAAQQPFEYACHEGNYAMKNILSAARSDDHEAVPFPPR